MCHMTQQTPTDGDDYQNKCVLDRQQGVRGENPGVMDGKSTGGGKWHTQEGGRWEK